MEIATPADWAGVDCFFWGGAAIEIGAPVDGVGAGAGWYWGGVRAFGVLRAIAIALPVNGVREDWFRNDEVAMGTGVGTTVVARDRCGSGFEMEAAAKETESGVTSKSESY
eukprot:jgi/Undpi1/13960/HiC_scaffold_9.g03611.m1